MAIKVNEEDDDEKRNQMQSVASKNKENINSEDKPKNNTPLKSQTAQSSAAGYTSDEWKQLLDGSVDGDTAPIFLEATYDSLKMTEGLEITALKDVLEDKFPKDFANLSPEEKEDKIQELKDNLNAPELSKFNISWYTVFC